MKKLVSLILAIMLITLSLITASAYDPVHPVDYVKGYFEKLYRTVEEDYYVFDGRTIAEYFYIQSDRYDYVVVSFKSNEPEQEPYFNRFGENNEYYEYSDATNLLYGSGITVFYGLTHVYPDDHNEDFYSLEEVAKTSPAAIEWIIEWAKNNLGPGRVGYIGDADCDAKVTILDATAIQRHLAQLDALRVELANDVDNNGYVDVMDATTIQIKLVGLE